MSAISTYQRLAPLHRQLHYLFIKDAGHHPQTTAWGLHGPTGDGGLPWEGGGDPGSWCGARLQPKTV